MGVNLENAREVFTYHAPTSPAVRASYERIRSAGYALALAILEEVPDCADQQAAIRMVREATMTANAGIALLGMV